MKITCLWSIILFCFSLSLCAQDTGFKRMKLGFEKATSDTAKLRILFAEKPTEYMNNSDELLSLYQQGYSIAKRQEDKVNRFKAAHYIALTYMYGKLDENTAFRWLQKALTEAEATQNNLYIGWVYYAMGIIHDHQGHRKEMYKAFYRSVDYLEKAPVFFNGPFLGLAQNLEIDKKWKAQLAINKRLIALIDRTQVPKNELLLSYNSLVDALKHFPERKREMAYYRDKTLKFLDKIATSHLYPDDILFIASIYYKYNRFDLAIKEAKKIVDLTDTAGFELPVKGMTYKFLSEIYEERKEYAPALKHFKQYQLIETEQITKRMTDDAGKKIIKAEAERDIAIKQSEIEQQQLYAYLAIAIAGLVILLSGSIYYFYRREQARKFELQHLNATKDKLFAILSHDLRSPVGNLENNVMLTNWGALSQEEFIQATQSLGREIGQVRNMLDNVLHWSVSQMGGMKPNKAKIAVFPIVETQMKLLLPNAEAKGVRITNTVAPEARLNVDSNHLGIIVRNLLQNAVKFTPIGGEVSLRSYDKGGHVCLEIGDTGIGIARARLRTLFEINKESSSQGTAQEQGTGLGLVLVKELVEANGGTVEVSSEINEGTTFVVIFKKETGLLKRNSPVESRSSISNFILL